MAAKSKPDTGKQGANKQGRSATSDSPHHTEAALDALPSPKNAKTVTLGLLQHACEADPAANLKKTLALTEKAAKQGAKIICTQELFPAQARAPSRPSPRSIKW